MSERGTPAGVGLSEGLGPGQCASAWGGRETGPVLYTRDEVMALLTAERAESARLRHLLNLARDDYNTAAQRLQDIGDYAHDHSTGPAVPDALWEVRSMAYGSGA